MQRIKATAVLLVAVLGYSSASLQFVSKSYTEQPILKSTANSELGTTLLTTTPEVGLESSSSSSVGTGASSVSAESSSSAEMHAPAASLPEQEEESSWSELFEPGPPSFPMAVQKPSRRRVVTYDQRQEGKFNVRADLENFMIVLIPPGAASSSGIFDLFTKSAQSRSPSKKDKRRYHHGAGGSQSAPTKYQNSVNIGTTNQNLNYLSRPTATTLHGYATEDGGATVLPMRRLSEFIEGRTPYHVDITANDDEQSHLRVSERQVDVLPPPYPLAYPHLIKPYHLEAEPTLIQTLPPPEIARGTHVPANILDTFNQMLNSGLQSSALSGVQEKHSASVSPKSSSSYYRMSRALLNHNDYETNELNPSSIMDPQHRLVHLFLPYLSPYPPIDLPDHHRAAYNKLHSSSIYNMQRERNTDNAPEQLLLDDTQLDGFGNPIGDIVLPAPEELELEMPGILDAKARDLLGDGLERCAPGRRRDSYGMCREIDDAY